MRSIVAVLASLIASTAALLFFDFFGLHGSSTNRAQAQTASKPNILFVITDDQPMDTMGVIPRSTREFVT